MRRDQRDSQRIVCEGQIDHIKKRVILIGIISKTDDLHIISKIP